MDIPAVLFFVAMSIFVVLYWTAGRRPKRAADRLAKAAELSGLEYRVESYSGNLVGSPEMAEMDERFQKLFGTVMKSMMGNHDNAPVIVGQRGDYGVRIEVKSPDGESLSTSYEVGYPVGKNRPSFVLRNRSWTDRFKKPPGRMSKVELGESGFDKKFVIHAVDHAAVVLYLTPVRRQSIVALEERWSEIEVSDVAVEVQSGRNVPRDPNEIVANIEELLAVAQVLKPNSDRSFPGE